MPTPLVPNHPCNASEGEETGQQRRWLETEAATRCCHVVIVLAIVGRPAVAGVGSASRERWDECSARGEREADRGRARVGERGTHGRVDPVILRCGSSERHRRASTTLARPTVARWSAAERASSHWPNDARTHTTMCERQRHMSVTTDLRSSQSPPCQRGVATVKCTSDSELSH
jgi:hypothetical protein